MIASEAAISIPPKVRSPLTFARYSVPHREHIERNDDTILLDRRRGLAAVFDGVGSGPGHVASRLAAQVIRRAWLHMQPQPVVVTDEECDVEDTLCQLIEDAHEQICLEGDRRTMSMDSLIASAFYPATTIVIALFYKRAATIQGYRMSYAHVGDSRIYLWRREQPLQRLTEDDGLLSLKLQEGFLKPADVLRIDQATSYEELNEIEQYCFENRNAITQALGSHKPLAIHVNTIDLLPGDRVLLCSDGIHDNLTDKELASVLQKSGRTAVAKKIVQRAIECANSENFTNIRAKCDDMSAVVVSCEEFNEHASF